MDEEKIQQTEAEDKAVELEIVAGQDDHENEDSGQQPVSTLQQMKQQASEDDEAPAGSLSLRQILGGDYLFSLVKNHIMLILLVVFITTIYVGIRYQCQQDLIEMNQLEKDLEKAKNKALSSSSNLTEMCRQSNVLQQNQDTLLKLSDQPPFIIEVPEE